MKVFIIILIFFPFFYSGSNEQFSSKSNIKDFLKDFAKGPEAYLEKIGSKVKNQIVYEILKSSLNDFLNSSSESSTPLNIKDMNFQNIMPLLNFLSAMNLTNHTTEELEKIIWEALPYEYSKIDFVKLKYNVSIMEDFSQKFIKNLLEIFSKNKLDLFDYFYEKLKTSANSSDFNLTEKTNFLEVFSKEILSNKNISDLAKNIHQKLKGEKEKTVQKSQNEFSYNGILIGLSIFFLGIIVVIAFFIRRFYKKKSSNAYNEMACTQLNT